MRTKVYVGRLVGWIVPLLPPLHLGTALLLLLLPPPLCYMASLYMLRIYVLYGCLCLTRVRSLAFRLLASVLSKFIITGNVKPEEFELYVVSLPNVYAESTSDPDRFEPKRYRHRMVDWHHRFLHCVFVRRYMPIAGDKILYFMRRTTK